MSALGVLSHVTHYKASVHAAASEVRSVFSQVHRAQPLHYAVIGPLHHLRWRGFILNQSDTNTFIRKLGFKRRRENYMLDHMSDLYLKTRRNRYNSTHLVSGSAPQAVRVELVDVENVDGALDAQMMELTGDLQE